MKLKPTLIILLILLVPIVQGNEDFEEDPNVDFEEDPNSVNYQDLENPTIGDFNKLDSEEQHQVYSDKNIW